MMTTLDTVIGKRVQARLLETANLNILASEMLSRYKRVDAETIQNAVKVIDNLTRSAGFQPENEPNKMLPYGAFTNDICYSWYKSPEESINTVGELKTFNNKIEKNVKGIRKSWEKFDFSNPSLPFWVSWTYSSVPGRNYTTILSIIVKKRSIPFRKPVAVLGHSNKFPSAQLWVIKKKGQTENSVWLIDTKYSDQPTCFLEKLERGLTAEEVIDLLNKDTYASSCFKRWGGVTWTIDKNTIVS